MKEKSKSESEFGKGLCYCLGLFLCHAERYGWHSRMVGNETLDKFQGLFEAEMWFNAASDHLYELQVDSAPKELRSRLSKFQDKCLTWGHGFQKPEATEEDMKWAIQEAKDLLRLIDEQQGIPTEQGQWE